MKIWKSIWKTLNIDIQDAVSPTVDGLKQILELAKALKEQKNAQELAPIVSHVSSLLDVLNSPLVQVAGTTLPFISIATQIITFIVKTNKTEPDIALSVALVSQAAYVESFKKFLKDDSALQNKLTNTNASESVAQQIKKLGQQELELNQEEIEETLICFHNSKLAQQFNPILIARLLESGLLDHEAKILTERVSRHTYRYMKSILADIQSSVPHLAKKYGGDWINDAKNYKSIDDYLEDEIAKEPLKKVFNEEELSVQDIYVPLEVKQINDEEIAAENIEQWATKILLDEKKKTQVLFIQANPGRGKSVFCRMFADFVRRELHPIYTPILIRLRDIKDIKSNFQETISTVLDRHFVRSHNGWLTNRNTRFLFLLDGFDELILERGVDNKLKQFLQEIASFQERCAKNKEQEHRVLITGRPLALYGIEYRMPTNLEKVKIIPMSLSIRGKWFDKWRNIIDVKSQDIESKINELEEFLNSKDCPEGIKKLGEEPLVLYMLTAMYRDNALDIQMFNNVDRGIAKVLVYEQTIEWVLKKQRTPDLSLEITKLANIDDIRSILRETALCVVQFRVSYAKIDTLYSRLKDNLNNIFERQIKQESGESKKVEGGNFLNTILTTFYIEAKEKQENSVEFMHNSFSEFLFAEIIVQNFKRWTKRDTDERNQPFTVQDNTFGDEIYDLVGYGNLTLEIVEYVMALLKQWHDEEPNKITVNIIDLFQRFNHFYIKWSNGYFIDQPGESLPEKKARRVNELGIIYQPKIQTSQRKVDIFTGLNILILLLELHRYGLSREELKNQITFYPCGNKDTGDFDKMRLFRVIGYSSILEKDHDDNIKASAFGGIVGKFLSHVQLDGAYLRGVNFYNANLSNAKLSNSRLPGVNLSHANLKNADLSKTELYGANCDQADFTNANLTEAHLHGAYLKKAALIKANLSHANLRRINLSGADLAGATLDSPKIDGAYVEDVLWGTTIDWSNTIGLHKVNGFPKSFKEDPKFQAALILSQGHELATEGKIELAIKKYEEAQEKNTKLRISATFWNKLAWCGCLYGYHQNSDIKEAAEKAVEVDPGNGNYLDTIGLIRILNDPTRKKEAIQDFQAALEKKHSYFEKDEYRRKRREKWIEELQAGNNPFTLEEIESLRKE